MPSQVTHQLFADRALGAIRPAGAVPFAHLACLGAQGPDLFLHNQRLKPSAFGYGRSLHRGGYGAFVAAMVAEALARGADPAEEAFVLALATHAFLDRATHPFIVFFAGWPDPGNPATAGFHGLHAFFERIIDALLWERAGGTSGTGGLPAPSGFSAGTPGGWRPLAIRRLDFLALADCGPEIPCGPAALLAAAVRAIDPGAPDNLSGRIGNAYLDTMNFYRLTNPPNAAGRRSAFEHDTAPGARGRFLPLFHPESLPAGIDFLNDARGPWRDPFTGRERSESFGDLWEGALGACVPALALIAGAFAAAREGGGVGGREGGAVPPSGNPDCGAVASHALLAEIEGAVGNGNLSDGSAGSPRPRFMGPLPLTGVLGAIYRRGGGS